MTKEKSALESNPERSGVELCRVAAYLNPSMQPIAALRLISSFGWKRGNSTQLSWRLKSGAFKSLTRPDHFRYGPLQGKSSTRWQVELNRFAVAL